MKVSMPLEIEIIILFQSLFSSLTKTIERKDMNLG